MIRVIKTGYVVLKRDLNSAQKNTRITYQSKNWVIWRATVTLTTCEYCATMNGHILARNDSRIDGIPVHPNCRCYVEAVIAIVAGTATSDGANGVDLYVAINGILPNNYLNKKNAQKMGWVPLQGNLAEVLPGMLIGGDRYKNRDERLPNALGRVWYEADFDYISGYRNDCRLLYSNDGLIFITYDHYATFYEIGLGATA